MQVRVLTSDGRLVCTGSRPNASVGFSLRTPASLWHHQWHWHWHWHWMLHALDAPVISLSCVSLSRRTCEPPQATPQTRMWRTRCPPLAGLDGVNQRFQTGTTWNEKAATQPPQKATKKGEDTAERPLMKVDTLALCYFRGTACTPLRPAARVASARCLCLGLLRSWMYCPCSLHACLGEPRWHRVT